MPGPALGVVGAVVGGVAQASAANKAAKAQQNAANQDIAFQTETRDLIRNDLAPYRTGGYTAQQALDYEMGLGAAPMIGGSTPQIEEFDETTPGRFQPGGPSSDKNLFGGSTNPLGLNTPGVMGGPTTTRKFRVNGQVFNTREEAQAFANANRTGGTAYGGFTKTPGYDFRLREGTSALEAGAAARGGLYSGAAMRDLLRYGQDYASSEYDKYLNRLAGRADSGMAAAQMSGAASQQAAAGVSNALAGAGNARAAGAIGVGNAIAGGIGNALGAWNYQQNMRAGA